MNVLAFDIETVPDVEGGRRLYHLQGLSDTEVAEALLQQRRQQTGDEFLRPHLQRVVAISVVLRHPERGLKVWSLGQPSDSEEELLQRFFTGLVHYTPTLVSWNGTGFDLPVLHYRALLYGISCACYWDIGEGDKQARWNNYLNRYHWRHIDVMDVLSGYQPRLAAPLDEIALLLGLPGKLGMNGSQVWHYFQRGDIQHIRRYCETDAVNTYLVYLRFEWMRANLTAAEYHNECQRLHNYLASLPEPHWQVFLQNWHYTEPAVSNRASNR